MKELTPRFHIRKDRPFRKTEKKQKMGSGLYRRRKTPQRKRENPETSPKTRNKKRKKRDRKVVSYRMYLNFV